MATEYAPLNHYVYPVLDVECCCWICSEWRRQRDLFDDMKRLTLTHTRSCMCWRCRKRREHQNSFLAAASRRELYSEMSFHAAHNKSYGPVLMNWISRELAESTETDGWWSTLAQAYSLSLWFSKFQGAVYPESRVQAPVVKVPIPSERWWCSWCGDDLPEGVSLYCSDDCAVDHQAFTVVNLPRPPRRRLVETVSGWVQAISGHAPPAVSGVAA